MIRRHGFLRKYIGRDTKPSRRRERQQRVEVDSRRTAYQDHDGSRSNVRQLTSADKTLVLFCCRGDQEYNARLVKGRFEVDRLAALVANKRSRKPGVVHQNARLKPIEETTQCAPEIPESDDTKRSAREQKRVGVAGQPVALP